MDQNIGGIDSGFLLRLAAFAVFLLIATRIVFAKGTGRGVATLFAVRYSLLFGAFILTMPWLFLKAGRSMLGTTFVLPFWAEVALVMFFIVTAAWVVMATWYLTLQHAAERLPDLAPEAGGRPAFAERLVASPFRRLVFTTVVTTPSMLAIIASSHIGRPVDSISELFTALFALSALPNWLAIIAGLAGALGLLYLNFSVFRVFDGRKPESFELFTDIFANPILAKASNRSLAGRFRAVLGQLDSILMAVIEPLVRAAGLMLRIVLWPFAFLARWLARIADFHFDELGPGYFDPSGRLLPAHRFALLQLGVLSVIYIAAGFAFSPFIGQTDHYSLPVVGYIAILLMILTYSLSGIAYFLDRWRFPTTIFVAVAIAVLGLFPSIDHYYSTPPRTDCVGCDWAPLTPDDAIAEWWEAEGCEADPPMIAVAASGGGIRAGAWTVEVLTALEEMYGASFVRSLSTISSVSGGSVGSVQYLLDFPTCAPRTSKRLNEIRESTAANSLSATAWGIVYPDFLRVVLSPLIELWPNAEDWDRAAATEAAWRTKTEAVNKDVDAKATLGRWRADIRRGQRPVALINTTTVETGETFIMSPVDIDPSLEGLTGVPSFFNEYPAHDVRVLTAARMSATFPWVSPVARPDLVLDGDSEVAESSEAGDAIAKKSRPFYLADGGYFDNFGVATLIRWLSAIVPTYADLDSRSADDSDRKLLILLIRDSTRVPPDSQDFGQAKGLRYELTGPIETVLNARGSTQNSRNANELLLFKQLWDLEAKAAGSNVRVSDVHFELENDVSGEVSLSWMLTDHERDLLKGALCDMVAAARTGTAAAANNPFAVVGTYLGVDVAGTPLPQRCEASGETDSDA